MAQKGAEPSNKDHVGIITFLFQLGFFPNPNHSEISFSMKIEFFGRF